MGRCLRRPAHLPLSVVGMVHKPAFLIAEKTIPRQSWSDPTDAVINLMEYNPQA